MNSAENVLKSEAFNEYHELQLPVTFANLILIFPSLLQGSGPQVDRT